MVVIDAHWTHRLKMKLLGKDLPIHEYSHLWHMGDYAELSEEFVRHAVATAMAAPCRLCNYTVYVSSPRPVSYWAAFCQSVP
ncbi:hypothetical protein GCM10010401_17850 [Rarobacter faecitabidus]|uniref:Uncharacterized protein n=1 Tax=Rarobacter faecitabidus TaxID=13243 RepID=A0A542ZUI6_RARFA|nr:hypothetical protein FB461_0480 [Rarobacter faecitabidus]